MRALETGVEGRQHQTRLDQGPGHVVMLLEQLPVAGRELGLRHVDHAERVLRLLHLVLVPHRAVGHPRRPLEVVDVVDPLQVHRDALEPVGQLHRHRRELDAAGLLEVGELGDLHPVEQHLPPDAPRAEGGRLPVVLLEAHVVADGVDAAHPQAVEIEVLRRVRRRLQDDLELVVLEQPVRVLAEAAVGGAPRRLHVGDPPRPGPEHAQERLGVHGAGPHLGVEGLVDQAAARRPEARQRRDQVLKGHRATARVMRSCVIVMMASLPRWPPMAKAPLHFERRCIPPEPGKRRLRLRCRPTTPAGRVRRDRHSLPVALPLGRICPDTLPCRALSGGHLVALRANAGFHRGPAVRAIARNTLAARNSFSRCIASRRRCA